MSDFVFRLLPVQPDFIPSPEATENIKQIIHKLKLNADAVSCRIEDRIVFVDAGENWGKVICPVCKEPLSDEWWSQAMGIAWETNFSNLITRTSCCNSDVSLNDLEYEWKVGFARFIVEILNPQKTLSSSDKAILEEVIGCKMKHIEAYI